MAGSLSGMVVGAGVIGQVHARIVSEHPATELTAVVDIDEEVAVSVGDEHGAAVVDTSMESVLERESVDFVIVATPEEAHVGPTVTALEAGCDVLLEKPIAKTIEQAKTIGQHVQSSEQQLMMGFTLRCDKRYSGVKERIDGGEFGSILGIQAARIANRYIYQRAVDWADPMTYLASHDIDAMRWFVDAPVERVYAEASPSLPAGDEPAVIHSVLRFASGTVGTLETNWARTDSYPAHRTDEIRLTGTEGHARLVLEAEDDGAVVSTEEPRKEQEHDAGRPEVPAHYFLPDTELHGRRVDIFRWQIDAFVDVVNGHKEPLATWEDGLRAHEISDALTESYQTGEPKTIPRPDDIESQTE